VGFSACFLGFSLVVCSRIPILPPGGDASQPIHL
jgi:hypothetical protein